MQYYLEQKPGQDKVLAADSSEAFENWFESLGWHLGGGKPEDIDFAKARYDIYATEKGKFAAECFNTGFHAGFNAAVEKLLADIPDFIRQKMLAEMYS